MPAPPQEGIEPRGKSGRLSAAAAVYSIGDPTPEEQLYLELINRTRENPAAEATRLAVITDPDILAAYKNPGNEVDLALMQTQIAAFIPAQPLAMNAKLTTAARGHSQDMFTNVFQDHNSWDGRTPFDRLTAVGYAGSAGENIYAYAKSVAHGHAGFEVDWGGSPETGGMQSPPGHRQTIHNPLYREVGIGVVLGSNQAAGRQTVGPQLVTQDFGTAQNSTPFITGVAYYDLNGNSFYDIGEGIGNVRVTVSGAAQEGITARSGGYAVPVPGNGSYTVTFSGAGFANFSQNVSVLGSKNLKVDFTPPYTPPQVSGPAVAAIARKNNYTCSAVPGASSYEYRSFQKVPAVAEGAENDMARVSISQTGSYDVFQGIVVKSGSYAFHLAMPTQAAQYITLQPNYLINAGSTLTFQSRMGIATVDQRAQVQISTDDGATWSVVYDQIGAYTGGNANPVTEQSFIQRTVSLGHYAGKLVRCRFAFAIVPGDLGYFPWLDLEYGWLIDDIQFSNVQEVANERIGVPTGNTIEFQPDLSGDFSLQARAKSGHIFLPWGPTLPITAAPASGVPDLRLSVRQNGNQLLFDVELVSGAKPTQLRLQSKGSLADPWQNEAVTVQSLSGTTFQAALPQPGGQMRFFRINAEQ